MNIDKFQRVQLKSSSSPADVQFASSLTTFRQKLKTHLFRQSYPDIVL